MTVRFALSALLAASLGAACVSEQLEPRRPSWDFLSEQPAVVVDGPAPSGVSAAPIDDFPLDLITPASSADLDAGPDFLNGGSSSPYHSLGPNVIRGLDGSWTKMFLLKGGRGTKVVEMLRAYVPAFPAEANTPSPLEGAPTEIIRYMLHDGFHRDDTRDKFGERNALGSEVVADVLHLTAPPDVLLFVTELLHRTLGDLPQIELEVRVVEVNLTDTLDFDSKLVARNLENPDAAFDPVTNPTKGNFGAGLPIEDPAGSGDTGIGAGFNSFGNPPSLSGFLLSLQGVHNDLRIDSVLSFLQSIGSAELISSPTVTVLNGHRARLITGEKVPVFQASGNVNNPNVSTVFEPTGVTIEMIPFIVSEDLVRIDLSIEVSAQTGSVPFNISGTDVSSPIISQRAAGTTVHVYDEQTFALGGLKQSAQIETLTKVPLLGDLPILGWLFKSRTSEMRNTEILFFVKPRILIPSETLINPLDS
ncbi:MAG: hypothetical protein DHS20C15_14620 [Planctomycetota bacterium]|nr:MAG: hypothetical protein DHS20C15_14620 [Planctomycetota bacterium]